MFMGKYSLNIRPVREKKTDGDLSTDPFIGVEVAAAYSAVAKDLITHAAVTIGGVFAACQIVKRICK